jgi:hypothetical protein
VAVGAALALDGDASSRLRVVLNGSWHGSLPRAAPEYPAQAEEQDNLVCTGGNLYLANAGRPPVNGLGAQCARQISQEIDHMLWTIIVVLFILWLLGFSLHIGGGLIHILLVLAVIVLIYNLVVGRRAI